MSKMTASKTAAEMGSRNNSRADQADNTAEFPGDRAGRSNEGAVAPEIRQQRVAELAYLRAECRGFTPGCELDDWLAAEQEVDALSRMECQSRETA